MPYLILQHRVGLFPYATWSSYLFDNTNTNSRSFTNVNIGAEDPTRVLIFSTYGTSSGATYTSDVTINNTITATKRFEVTTSANSARLSVWTAPVPTGTTCTIDTTQVSPGAGYQSIQIFSAYGLTSEVPVATATDTTEPIDALSVPVNSGDLAIAFAEGARNSSPMSFTWTGITERSDESNLDFSIYYTGSTSAYDKQTSAGTLNPTVVADAGVINGAVIGVWR